MKRWLIWSWIAVACCGAAAVELVRDGVARLPIVVPADASPAERTAAVELADGIAKISGARPDIVATVPAGAPAIYLGQSAAVRELLDGIDFAALRPDELIVKSVGDALVLSGDRPRGTLYAVYDLLERDLGVRFWSAAVTEYPEQKTIAVTADRRDAPVFRVRDTDYWAVKRDKQFAARLRYNGDFGYCNLLPEEYGGSVCILGWCHTFHRLIPAAEYFATHPEWFAENNGQRVAHEFASQLCMTNPELQRELARKLAEWLRATPGTRIVSLSINDGGTICQCAECARIDAAEGTGAGSVLTGINAVAALLQTEFPDVMIETLGYAGMTQAPKHLRAAPNVVVRVCSMLANQAKRLDSETNAGFRDALQNWRRQADALLVWNYTVNFNDPFMPHPNLSQIAPDLRFFAANGAIGVFQEAEQTWDAPDLVDLRLWLYSKLLWNPNCDENALIEEFLNGYYRAAAPFVHSYLQAREAAAQRYGSLAMYASSSGWIGFEELLAWEKMLDQARAAVADQPEMLDRIDRLALPLSLTIVQRPELNVVSEGQAALARREAVGYEERCRRIGEFLRREKMYDPATGWMVADQQFKRLSGDADAHWLAKVGAEPEFCAGREYLELSAANGNFYQAAICEMVDDPAAAGGKAVEMTKVSVPWTLQVAVPPGTATARWQIYVSARYDFGTGDYPAERPVMSGSYYVPAGEQIFPFLHFAAAQFDGEGYRWLKFGEPTQFSGGGYLYMNPHQISDESKLRIDRIILVRQ